jgi:SHS2 domain-containing protein
MWDRLLSKSKGYRYLEHMTDAEIEASGKTMDEAFENAGRAVENLMADLASVKPKETREMQREERDLGALLYDWIEALIAFQDDEGLLFSQFKCEISKSSTNKFLLRTKLAGEKFDPKRHEQKTAIKAPTFHDMKISQTHNRVTLRFLVDL